MSAFIENMAKAMYDRFHELVAPNFAPGWKPTPFSSAGEHTCDYYLESARSGVERLRDDIATMLNNDADRRVVKSFLDEVLR